MKPITQVEWTFMLLFCPFRACQLLVSFSLKSMWVWNNMKVSQIQQFSFWMNCTTFQLWGT